MKYNEILNVNENFQYSINLQFDINNISKLKSYIPTKDSCDIMKVYIDSILNKKNRATVLIGPYGKGKSHLLLVLLMLISNYNNTDNKIIKDLLDRIKQIDEELFEKIGIMQVREKIRLLPVIINSNYTNLNQAFLLGIKDALERENINDLVIDTFYDSAIDTLLGWKNNYVEVQKTLNEELTKYSETFNSIITKLKKCNDEAYEIFKNIYKTITYGQEFNPLINSDIVKIYKDITYKLSSKGFDGIFIAFDEFSKFIDSCELDNIMKDLKILQDFAELSNRTGRNEQIHLCCITHKAINEYLVDNNEDKINAFKTVEGRFKNLYFNRSMEQNYQIVSKAIEKNENYDSFFEKYYEKNIELYLDLKYLPIFKNVEDIENILFKGCFPLNPITVYSLIQLSEKIAQNERTLFTFITDDDENSLKTFIDNNNSGLFTIDKIYDYFEGIFKNTTDNKIKDIWIKTTNIINRDISEVGKKIVKCIAILYMVDELDTLSPNKLIIKLALNLQNEDFDNEISKLIDSSYIKQKKITNDYDFATVYSKQITKEIKDLILTQFADIDDTTVLSEIIGKSYSLPRRFNEEFKMTRFFTNIFLSENELINLNNFNLLHSNDFSDGLVINLIRTSKNIDEILEKYSKITDDKTILVISKHSFKKDFIDVLKEFNAVEYLISKNANENSILIELNSIKEELENIVKDTVKYYFSKDNIEYILFENKKITSFYNISSIISDICEKVYYKTPIINNELINKQTLSAPIKKAREIVIDTILSKNLNLISSKTSAEATIYRATAEKINNETIQCTINLISDFIKNSDKTKKSFLELYNELTSAPYGARKGIIPILLALSITNYSDNIILYYMNREIELNSSNLIKINDNPSSYFILTEKGTKEKKEYISSLKNIFNINSTEDRTISQDVILLVESIKKWMFSLPRIIRELNFQKNNLIIDNKYISIKKEILKPDINNNEFLFITIPNILNISDYKLIVVEITKLKETFENYCNAEKQLIIDKFKDVLNLNSNESLTVGLKNFYDNIPNGNKSVIFDIKTKDFINYIESLNNYNDLEIINKLSKIFTGFFIEDWQEDISDNMVDNFKDTILKLNKPIEVNENKLEKVVFSTNNKNETKSVFIDKEISTIGNTLKNNIEDIIDEYGESINVEERINILFSIIKKYL